MQTWQPEEKKEKNNKNKKTKLKFNLLQSNNKKDTKLIKQQKKYSQGLPFLFRGVGKEMKFLQDESSVVMEELNVSEPRLSKDPEKNVV